ncbi:major facilitator superfamily permease [Schinkia azotoformans LMG 9581]|uniref:Major facilitator superfamily permease n=2 Tax=Schinkia azotoformans TaxID=1454 RepID=K6E7H7_SCHAZ|nr:major facilitator superfamily permease [Schinkia azotoformans LMG 9581]
MDMGVGFGPFILGMFMPLLGYRNLYFASAILALLIAVIYHFVHGRLFRIQRTRWMIRINQNNGFCITCDF